MKLSSLNFGTYNLLGYLTFSKVARIFLHKWTYFFYVPWQWQYFSLNVLLVVYWSVFFFCICIPFEVMNTILVYYHGYYTYTNMDSGYNLSSCVIRATCGTQRQCRLQRNTYTNVPPQVSSIRCRNLSCKMNLWMTNKRRLGKLIILNLRLNKQLH